MPSCDNILFVLEICHCKKEWLDDWVCCLTDKARSSSSYLFLLVLLLFFLLFLSPQRIICFETFPNFPKLKSSSVSSMVGLLHSSMETYSWASLGSLCFYFNSIQKLPQFKDSLVSIMFAVCSVLIVNPYIYESVSSDYSQLWSY